MAPPAAQQQWAHLQTLRPRSLQCLTESLMHRPSAHLEALDLSLIHI